jgi:hypothetical protein
VLFALLGIGLNGCAALRGASDTCAIAHADPVAVPQVDPLLPEPARPAETLAHQADLGAAWVCDELAAGYRRTRDGVEAAMDCPAVTWALFPVGVAALLLGHGALGVSSGASSP